MALQRMKTARPKAVRWQWAAAITGVALVAAGWGYQQTTALDPGSHVVKYLKVTPGMSASSIGYQLGKMHVIRSALAFNVMSRIGNTSTHLNVGVYRVSPRDTVKQILQRIGSGDVVVTRVTIPEGYTVHQIIARLLAAHIGTAAAYRHLQEHPLAGMPAPSAGTKDPLEGYLFPSTYSFPRGTTATQAVTTMWNTFKARALPLYHRASSKMTLKQWVTLASIIQMEVRSAQDAPKIAAVFLNREAAHMPFQSDATVRYALGEPSVSGLTYGDLRIKSPYNTYRTVGYPPGPISNPGMTMLKAALHPAHVSYLYFLTLRSGKVLYATTYAQHLANIAWANAHP